MTNYPTLQPAERNLRAAEVAAPLVSIITLNWKQPRLTIECLDSLAKITYPNFNVYVLDNGSGDGSIEQIKEHLPRLPYRVGLIDSKANLGFAAGNNVAIEKALKEEAAFVLLLNNDTEVAPDFVEPLVETMQSEASIGVTGSKIYYFAEPKRIWSAGGIFTDSGWTRQLGVNETDTPELNRKKKVDYVSGCAMLVRRAVIEKVGMLDARFFMYYEETDWCARAANAGFSTWYVPQSVIWHKIELKARDASPFYIYLMTRNRLLFLHTLGRTKWQVLLSVGLVDLRTILAWSVWKRYEPVRYLRYAKILGIWDYLRGHFGAPPAKLR